MATFNHQLHRSSLGAYTVLTIIGLLLEFRIIGPQNSRLILKSLSDAKKTEKHCFKIYKIQITDLLADTPVQKYIFSIKLA